MRRLLWLRHPGSLPKVTSPCGPRGEGSLAARASKDTGRSSGQPIMGSPGTWEALTGGLSLLSPRLPLHRAHPAHHLPLTLQRLRHSRRGIQLFSPEIRPAEVQTDQNAQPLFLLSPGYPSNPRKASKAGYPQKSQLEHSASLAPVPPHSTTTSSPATALGEGPGPPGVKAG